MGSIDKRMAHAGHVAALMEHAADAVILTDPQGVIEYVNPAFEALSGYARDEAVGRTPAILKSGRQPGDFYRRLWETVRAGGEFRDVLINRRKTGEIFHEEKSIRPLVDDRGRIAHFLSTGHDVSERIARLEQLAHAATHDPLTGLPNRRLFGEWLTQAIGQACRCSAGFVVAIVDVDGFKAVNDSRGHEAGDALLCAVAQRLHQVLRKTDSAARLGGDEFGLVLRGVDDAEHALSVLREILAAFDAPVVFEGNVLSLAVSLGACLGADAGDARSLLRRADAALYRAKRQGGSGFALHDVSDDCVADSVRAAASAELALLRSVDGAFRRTVRRGSSVYRRGQAFANLYVLSAGSIKLVNGADGGREQVVALHLPGDWIGLDGIATARYRCDAIAMDVAEVWGVPYAALLACASRSPALLGALHAAMSGEIVRDHDLMVSLNSLPPTARVAAFLHRWAGDLATRGLRNDRITLRLTRAEIGRHLGISLETVSRVMTALEREGLVAFGEGRRDLVLPDPAGLAALANGPD